VGLSSKRDCSRLRDGGKDHLVSACELTRHRFDSDLPEWEGVGSPEASIAGTRVAAIAKREADPVILGRSRLRSTQ